MAANGNLFGVGFNIVSKTCPSVLPAHLLNGNTALCHCSTLGTIGNGVYVVAVERGSWENCSLLDERQGDVYQSRQASAGVRR